MPNRPFQLRVNRLKATKEDVVWPLQFENGSKREKHVIAFISFLKA
tara:strand:- start:334 stop:471 length:138 start_codon:yes stop_codon:yes gene_type:complete